MPEEPQFLFQSVFQAAEAAYVGFTYYGEDPVIGTNHRFEAIHFAWEADSGFYQGHFVFRPHAQQSQRGPYLSIVRQR